MDSQGLNYVLRAYRCFLFTKISFCFTLVRIFCLAFWGKGVYEKKKSTFFIVILYFGGVFCDLYICMYGFYQLSSGGLLSLPKKV